MLTYIALIYPIREFKYTWMSLLLTFALTTDKISNDAESRILGKECYGISFPKTGNCGNLLSLAIVMNETLPPVDILITITRLACVIGFIYLLAPLPLSIWLAITQVFVNAHELPLAVIRFGRIQFFLRNQLVVWSDRLIIKIWTAQLCQITKELIQLFNCLQEFKRFCIIVVLC